MNELYLSWFFALLAIFLYYAFSCTEKFFDLKPNKPKVITTIIFSVPLLFLIIYVTVYSPSPSALAQSTYQSRDHLDTGYITEMQVWHDERLHNEYWKITYEEKVGSYVLSDNIYMPYLGVKDTLVQELAPMDQIVVNNGKITHIEKY